MVMGDSTVVTGQIITSESGFLRGHGTYIDHGNEENNQKGPKQRLIASVSGTVGRVNRLISVRPPRSRYIGEVGDLVVGRITEVGSKRWKVNIGAYQDAVLQLSSVNLPSGIQRIRTQKDELEMRQLFVESDLISAEVQQVNSGDGAVFLHTRSLRYGKLENGLLVQVPQALVQRLKQHLISLPVANVDAIIGTNGFIWITRAGGVTCSTATSTSGGGWGSTDTEEVMAKGAEAIEQRRKQHNSSLIIGDDRMSISRIRNAIVVLRMANTFITPVMKIQPAADGI